MVRTSTTSAQLIVDTLVKPRDSAPTTDYLKMFYLAQPGNYAL
jgi:hypothetical protein